MARPYMCYITESLKDGLQVSTLIDQFRISSCCWLKWLRAHFSLILVLLLSIQKYEKSHVQQHTQL